MDELIAKTVISHLLYNPDGVAGKITVNYKNKPIIFHFELKAFFDDSIYTIFTRNGKMLYFRLSNPPADNMEMLTSDERFLVSCLMIGVLKVMEEYENILDSKLAKSFIDNQLVEVETDILPKNESDRAGLFSVLEETPIDVM